MNAEKEEFMFKIKKQKEQIIKDEMEKVEIATILCHSCSVEQMRYLKSHATIIVKRQRILQR